MKNYETRVVRVALDNDPELYNIVSDYAKEAIASMDPVDRLAERLQLYFVGEKPTDLPPVYNTFLDSALSEVNWHIIADLWLEDLQKADEES